MAQPRRGRARGPGFGCRRLLLMCRRGTRCCCCRILVDCTPGMLHATPEALETASALCRPMCVCLQHRRAANTALVPQTAPRACAARGSGRAERGGCRLARGRHAAALPRRALLLALLASLGERCRFGCSGSCQCRLEV